VFALILRLVEGPDADPRRRSVLDNYGPIVEALDTGRPLGLAVVMEFIRWALPDSDSNQRPKYEMVTELLEVYLEPANDNTPGVRSIYGMYLHVLLAHRPGWTRANRARIFVSTDRTGLGWAAWQAFLRTNGPSQRLRTPQP
jgi:hypothetical protein